MKTILKISSFLVLFIWTGIVVGQNNKISISEPEYIGNILLINDGQGINLEKQKASSKAKAGTSMYIVGVGKVKSSNVVSGANSSVRISEKDSIQFIVRVSDNNIDPFQMFNIFKLEQNLRKDQRFIETGNATSFSGSSTMDIDFIPFKAQKYGENSFLITIQRRLLPGEYAISVEGSRDLFNMFGID